MRSHEYTLCLLVQPQQRNKSSRKTFRDCGYSLRQVIIIMCLAEWRRGSSISIDLRPRRSRSVMVTVFLYATVVDHPASCLRLYFCLLTNQSLQPSQSCSAHLFSLRDQTTIFISVLYRVFLKSH